MKARIAIPIVSVLILALTTLPAYGQQEDRSKTIVDPGLPPAVEIENVEVVGQAVVGNTFKVRVRYTSYVDAAGQIDIRAPEAMALTAAPAGRRLIRQSHSFRKGQTQTKTFTLRGKKAAASIVHVGITVPNAPARYQKTASRELYIQNTKRSFDVFDPRKEGQKTPFGVRKAPLQKTVRGTLPEGMQMQSPQQDTVSGSGKVQFDAGFPDGLRGVYGVKVEFWFYDEDNSSFYHPVSGNQQNVHYDIVDEAGNYSFDFNFTEDMSEFESIVFDVSYENKAAHIAGLLQGQLFNHSFDANDASITFSKDLQIFAPEGAVMRHMMLAREFVYERYNGNPPFGFGSIKTRVRDLSGNTAGLFSLSYDWTGLDWDREISIDPAIGANVSTIVHEYGHWMHERMWDSPYDYTNAGEKFTEGWAVFFSFAGRNYAHATYGDALLGNDDNAEEAPFRIGEEDENGDPYRFKSMDDAVLGHPEQAAFSCLLWSLYDGYNGGNFEAAEYDPGDNDDVSGYGKLVFDTVISMDDDGALVSQYFNEFKDGLPGTLQPSAQDIYDFMFSDYVNIPNEPMRPPQLTNASGQINSNGNVDFQWIQRTYPTGLDYGNYPDGYRLYKDGQSVATVSFGTTSYTYAPSGTNSGNYRLTAYNGAGEGQAAPVLDLGIDVTLSGPYALGSGQQGTWSVSVGSCGPGSPSYAWEYQPTGSNTWQSKSCSGSSCSHTFINTDPNNATQYGGIRVTVTKGSYTRVVGRNIAVNCDNVICPMSANMAEGGQGVPLRNLEAQSPSSGTVALTWKTTRSLPPSRFRVQHRADSTAAWSTLGTVEASDGKQNGSEAGLAYRFQADELGVGTHQFRLAYATPGQAKESTWTSEVVSARIELEGAFELSTYPNPVRNQAVIELAVAKQQVVRVAAYDMLGRQVVVLHDGPVPAQRTQTLRLDAAQAGMASGQYFLRVTGEEFADTRRVTVVR